MSVESINTENTLILLNIIALFQPAIAFLRHNMKEIVPTMDSNLTFSMLKMLDCFFTPFIPKEVSLERVPIKCIEKVNFCIYKTFVLSKSAIYSEHRLSFIDTEHLQRH